jgi:hypothetical protein
MANYGGLSTVYHINRLAGTVINGVPQYDFNGACVKWADIVIPGHHATRGIDALNLIYAYRNGGTNYYEDTPGVLNLLAGTYGIGEAEAAARIAS